MTLEDPEAARLLAEVVELSGETPTQALRVALAERLGRLEREFKAHRKTGALSRDQADELFGY